MNATIRATHSGAGGDPLNVIAAVMLRLTVESNANTESAAAALDEMSEAANRASGSHAGTGDFTDEIRHAVAELHASSDSNFSRVNEIADLGAQLVADIGPVRSGFSAGPLFDRVVTRARRELERLEARAAQGASENVGLESLTRHYTMQTERDVHESVVQGAELVVAAPIGASRAMHGDGTWARTWNCSESRIIDRVRPTRTLSPARMRPRSPSRIRVVRTDACRLPRGHG